MMRRRKLEQVCDLLNIDRTRLLTPGATFAAGEDSLIGIGNMLNRRGGADASDDDAAYRAAERCASQVKSVLENCPGINKQQWAQLKCLFKMAQRALQPLGLALITHPRLAQHVQVSSARVVETIPPGVAEYVMLYCKATGQAEPAGEYRDAVRRKEQRDALRRWDLSLSQPPRDQSAAMQEDGAEPPSPVSGPRLFFTDPNACEERYDESACWALQNCLYQGTARRAEALEVAERELLRLSPGQDAHQRFELLKYRHAIVRCDDMMRCVNAILAIPDVEGGWIVQAVSYCQPRGMGRQYAQNVPTAVAGVPEPDPSEVSRLGEDRPRERRVCYQGMHADLRPVVCGGLLHDVDVRKCFCAVITSRAHQFDAARDRGQFGGNPSAAPTWERRLPNLIAYVTDPDPVLDRVAQFHRLGSTDDAKELLNRLVSGGGYGNWLSQRGLSDRMPLITSIVGEVNTFRTAIFAFVDKARIEFHRQALRGERLHDGMAPEAVRAAEAGIERSLWALWLQDTENELLKDIVVAVRESGWIVHALLFDGVLVERGAVADAVTLKDSLEQISGRLQSNGWKYVVLVEKPLHGLETELPRTAVAAREAVSALLEDNSWLGGGSPSGNSPSSSSVGSPSQGAGASAGAAPASPAPAGAAVPAAPLLLDGDDNDGWWQAVAEVEAEARAAATAAAPAATAAAAAAGPPP